MISNHKQDCRNGRHGDKGGIGHQEYEDQHKKNGMNHSRHWSPSSVFDVGGSPGNGACGRNSSKQGRTCISHTLSDQFHVGIVPASHHTVSHHTGQQGFNGSQKSDGHCIRQNLLHHGKRQTGYVKSRKAGGNDIQISNGVDG